MKRHKIAKTFLGLAMAVSLCARAADSPCPTSSGENGQARSVIAAIQAFEKTLDASQLALLERPLTRDSAIRWSNLPIGVVPRAGLRLGDLDAKQSDAAHRVAAAALSACGLKLFDEVRTADDFLMEVDKRKIGWSGANYYMSVLGTPSEKTPWMLQMGGHHIAYNFTFNGGHEGATPLFFGSEPIRFSYKGTDYEPLTAQSTAMAQLATALAAHPEAKLSGTFTDVVKGVVVVPVPGKCPAAAPTRDFRRPIPRATSIAESFTAR